MYSYLRITLNINIQIKLIGRHPVIKTSFYRKMARSILFKFSLYMQIIDSNQRAKSQGKKIIVLELISRT